MVLLNHFKDLTSQGGYTTYPTLGVTDRHNLVSNGACVVVCSVVYSGSSGSSSLSSSIRASSSLEGVGGWRNSTWRCFADGVVKSYSNPLPSTGVVVLTARIGVAFRGHMKNQLVGKSFSFMNTSTWYSILVSLIQCSW